MDLDRIDHERLEKSAFTGMTPEPVTDRPLAPAERLALVRELIAARKLPVGSSAHRKPAFYYPGLPAQPIYDTKDFPWASTVLAHIGDFVEELDALERRRREGQTAFHTVWPNFTEKGAWAAFWLRLYGEPYAENAALCPKTLAAVALAPGQGGWLGFSALAPRTHLAAHCGVTNAKLRCHVPLALVPGGSRIRVHDQVHAWREGELFIFDDSFEHEVWNDSDARRVVLIFDIFHPALDAAEVAFLETVESLTVKQSYNAMMKKYAAESSDVTWVYDQS